MMSADPERPEEARPEGGAFAHGDGRAGARRVSMPVAARNVQLVLGLGNVVAAGLSHLAGAPAFLTAMLAVLGAAGLAAALRAARANERLVTMVDETKARSREEVETLADRMWELQESEERFRGLVDALGDIVVHRDRDGRIVHANRVLADLLGRSPEELTGKTLSQLGIEIGIVPDAAFSHGECLSSTDVAIYARGGMRWFSWIELSVRDKASEAVSHRAIARDITARKRAETALINARERAEQASNAKSRFLATVSHEIRTPMNGIMGMARLLADTRLSPEQQTYVGAISTSASALLALIVDLLDYSKIEAGRFELEPQPVSAREMVEDVVELLAARAFAKDIGLGCHIAPGVPATISADPGRLRQVLLNLVGNAVKFTDAGGVLVTVTADARALRIAIADTGPGLHEADIKRIFDDFEQGDGSSTRRHGGAGLGLAISRRIMDAMNGSIEVASTPGEGATFTLVIPAGTDRGEAEEVGEVLSGRASLVVSPHPLEAEAVAMTIRAHGGRAEIATGAEEAASKVGESIEDFDAVLVDTALETGDGALLRRIRQAGLARAQAITLIAPTDRGRLAQFRGAGYEAFLARPVRSETLLRMLMNGRPDLQASRSPDGGRRAEGAASSTRADALEILIAEDNEINAMLARAALAKAGHSVEVVGNGRAAVEALTGAVNRYDVVLMDLHMPVMDGLDAIARIRRHEQETGLPPVPIIVLSADGQDVTRQGVLAHGASGFVTKPLDPDKLVAALESQAAA